VVNFARQQELKSGWKWVKFGDVVKLSTARCNDPLAQGIERYVGLEHIDLIDGQKSVRIRVRADEE
jgi:hypothetical protein